MPLTYKKKAITYNFDAYTLHSSLNNKADSEGNAKLKGAKKTTKHSNT